MADKRFYVSGVQRPQHFPPTQMPTIAVQSSCIQTYQRMASLQLLLSVKCTFTHTQQPFGTVVDTQLRAEYAGIIYTHMYILHR